MGVLPFRWQGATRIERLREQVLAQSRAWLRSWSATPESPACSVAALPTEQRTDAKASDRWFSMAVGAGTLWLRSPPKATELLGRSLVGTRVGEEQGMADGIGRRALTDLATQLVGGGTADDFVISLRPSASALDPRHGIVGFTWALEDARFELYFDAGLCDALVPAITHRADLTSRAEAVRPAQVTLHAVLDLGLASLEDTLVLRPGEVIKTGIALNQPVSMQTESGKTLFVGALVVQDGHRALRCTRTPSA